MMSTLYQCGAYLQPTISKKKKKEKKATFHVKQLGGSIAFEQQLEWHYVNHIPPPGCTVFVLYPTGRPDLDPDLNQNLIPLFLSPNQLIHIILLYHALYGFWPHLSMVKNQLKYIL